MESLLPELAASVARYLAPRDLAACTGVSVHWRDVFGTDELWKRLCDLEVEESLRTTPCVVEPAFSVYPEEDSTLTPLSRWRLAFLREQHLWSNWRKGNVKTFELTVEEATVRFITKDFLVNLGSNSIDLWDVRPVPPVRVSSVEVDIFIYTHFDVFGNYIVLENNNHTDIYEVDITKNTILLKHRFLLNETTRTLELVCANTPVSNRANSLDELKITIVKGKFCIGFFQFMAHHNSFHVWDLENGIKLKQESLSTNLLELGLYVHDSEKCDDVLVIVPHSMGSQPLKGIAEPEPIPTINLQCKVYDVPNQSFFNFSKTCSAEDANLSSFVCENYAIINNFVALTDYSLLYLVTVRIFNYRTDQLMYIFEENPDVLFKLEIINSMYTSKILWLLVDDCFIHLGEEILRERAFIRERDHDKLCLFFCSTGTIVKDVTGYKVTGGLGGVCGDRLVQVFPHNEFWIINRFGSFKTDFKFTEYIDVNKSRTKLVEQIKEDENDVIRILYFW